ncbi:hypothetical protein GCM10020370_29980 [Paenibacillus hodogayensis]
MADAVEPRIIDACRRMTVEAELSPLLPIPADAVRRSVKAAGSDRRTIRLSAPVETSARLGRVVALNRACPGLTAAPPCQMDKLSRIRW